MLSEAHLRGIEKRKISVEVATSMGLYSGRRLRDGSAEPDIDGDTLCFPYFERGEEINTKQRWVQDGEKRFMQVPGREKTFYNAEVLLDIDTMLQLETGTDALVITEGEFDALAAIQSGYHPTVSVPNGANLPARDKKTGQLIEVPQDTKDIDPENDQSFSYIARHMDRLMRVKNFLIATDADEVGQRLAKELVRRLGPARCSWVSYPADLVVMDRNTGEFRACKDLNEVLIHFDEAKVRECLENAKPWPVKGLFSFSDYPDMGEPQVFPTRLSPELDEIFRVYPGAFMVTTGIPNMGKSEIAKQIAVNMAINYGWHTTMFVGEEPIKPYLYDSLRTKYLRKEKRFWTPAERRRADDFVEAHFQIIGNDPRYDEDEIDVDFLLDKAATAVFRYGSKKLLVDPWNELEHKREGHYSLTEYVGEAIRKFKRFGRSYDVLTNIVAHPKKIDAGRAPGLYDISDCYSADTEVLTKRGWILHSEVTVDDQVLVFDPKTENLDYANPSRVVSFDHEGEMVRFKGYGYDLLVSPNHRMVIKPAWGDPVGLQAFTGIGRPTRWPKGEWSFAMARELGTGARFKLPKAGRPVIGDNPDHLLIGGEKVVPAEPFLELVGWWLAEGSIQGSGISLCQAVGDKATHIDGLIEACGFAPTRAERIDPRGFQTMVTWYFGARKDPELVRWIKDKAGSGSASKQIPYPVFSLSNRLKMALLQGYIDGDGHRPTTREGFKATTTSRQLSDDLMRLSVECGVPVCGHDKTPMKTEHAHQYQVDFGRELRREVTVRGSRNISIEPYFGKIWCLTVPTGAYVVRRNGKVAISGNSAHWANKPDLAMVVHGDDPYGTLRDIIIPKVRFKVAGKKGSVPMEFDRNLEMYIPVSDFDAQPQQDTA